jgi:hypothetical protein
MVALADLWLPIVLSAVLVFAVSSIIHMVLQIHSKDYLKLPREEDVLQTLRTHGVGPGQYVFPRAASMKDMGSPEMIAKYQQGPVGFMTVLPSGTPNMGKSLVQWFVLSLVISAFAAYAASLGLPAGTEYMRVFRVIGTVAIVGYGVSSAQDSIWKGIRWGTTAKYILDGVVYSLVTAGTFAWLWPDAV